MTEYIQIDVTNKNDFFDQDMMLEIIPFMLSKGYMFVGGTEPSTFDFIWNLETTIELGDDYIIEQLRNKDFDVTITRYDIDTIEKE